MKKIAIIITSIILFGCGDSGPKLDTTSAEAMKKSVTVMMDSLPKEEQAEFQKAIGVIMMSHMDTVMKSKNPDEAMKKVMKKHNGKSAQEIIDYANKIKEKNRKNQQQK